MKRGRPLAATTIDVGGVLLTETERHVLLALANGHDSDKLIARSMNVERSTVNSHLRQLFRKIGVHSRVAAAVWAVRQGIA